MNAAFKRVYTCIYVYISSIKGPLRRCDSLTLGTRCFLATSDAKKVNVHGRLTSLDKDRNAGGAQWCRRVVGWLLSFVLVLTAWPQTTMLAQDAQAPPAAPRGPEYATKNPEELQQLVAPIALYPDSLVAQILTAATFP